MTRIRTKICGIGTLAEAREAIAAGADALGFVFYSKSKRAIDLGLAKDIIRQLPPFVSTVGLVVNPCSDEVAKVIETGVDLIQFHGDEPETFCRQFSVPYIKAIGIDHRVDIVAEMQRYKSARAVLLDIKDPVNYGGTGQQFDWQLLTGVPLDQVIVAGGLNAHTLPQLLQQYRPFAVDVSSGVEYDQGGKCPKKVREFCSLVISS